MALKIESNKQRLLLFGKGHRPSALSVAHRQETLTPGQEAHVAEKRRSDDLRGFHARESSEARLDKYFDGAKLGRSAKADRARIPKITQLRGYGKSWTEMEERTWFRGEELKERWLKMCEGSTGRRV
ncbi:hypothetical protein L596_024169 [Steinernema carpocapsae]|uniref:Uncharacterized protein n=1 Tax=Steinernema carpocapsae TaxID=34508 RepID=A0A4U5MFY8_STECR|nr:hypothetical protein L596_024169 [Steinernema carpocapsae]